jgi:hypothetical protein
MLPSITLPEALSSTTLQAALKQIWSNWSSGVAAYPISGFYVTIQADVFGRGGYTCLTLITRSQEPKNKRHVNPHQTPHQTPTRNRYSNRASALSELLPNPEQVSAAEISVTKLPYSRNYSAVAVHTAIDFSGDEFNVRKHTADVHYPLPRRY